MNCLNLALLIIIIIINNSIKLLIQKMLDDILLFLISPREMLCLLQWTYGPHMCV